MICTIQCTKNRRNIILGIRKQIAYRIGFCTEPRAVYHIRMLHLIREQTGECRRQMPAQTVSRRRYLAYGDTQTQPSFISHLVKLVRTDLFDHFDRRAVCKETNRTVKFCFIDFF